MGSVLLRLFLEATTPAEKKLNGTHPKFILGAPASAATAGALLQHRELLSFVLRPWTHLCVLLQANPDPPSAGRRTSGCSELLPCHHCTLSSLTCPFPSQSSPTPRADENGNNLHWYNTQLMETCSLLARTKFSKLFSRCLAAHPAVTEPQDQLSWKRAPRPSSSTYDPRAPWC